MPDKFNLFPAFPNPFNPVTQIRFSIPTSEEQNPTSVSVYDLNGTLIERLSNGYLDSGNHQVIWNAGSHPSGMYFIRMQSGHFDKTIKTMLIK
jgi:flagellar hook assembly protein FlgD